MVVKVSPFLSGRILVDQDMDVLYDFATCPSRNSGT